MLTYSSGGLQGALELLPKTARAAFALAAATRQWRNYQYFADRRPAKAIDIKGKLSSIWRLVLSDPGKGELNAILEEIMGSLPDEGELLTLEDVLADHCISSLAYSVRALMFEDVNEAVWAAQRAYEAADQIAIKILNVQPGSRDSELKIINEPVVQRELQHQRDTLIVLNDELSAVLIEKLENFSFEIEFISSSEWFKIEH